MLLWMVLCICSLLLLLLLSFILFIHLFLNCFAVFIYSMPGYKCSIRERMLYSSCKNPLVDMVENKLQIEIAKKVRNNLTWIKLWSFVISPDWFDDTSKCCLILQQTAIEQLLKLVVSLQWWFHATHCASSFPLNSSCFLQAFHLSDHFPFAIFHTHQVKKRSCLFFAEAFLISDCCQC